MHSGHLGSSLSDDRFVLATDPRDLTRPNQALFYTALGAAYAMRPMETQNGLLLSQNNPHRSFVNGLLGTNFIQPKDYRVLHQTDGTRIQFGQGVSRLFYHPLPERIDENVTKCLISGLATNLRLTRPGKELLETPVTFPVVCENIMDASDRLGIDYIADATGQRVAFEADDISELLLKDFNCFSRDQIEANLYHGARSGVPSLQVPPLTDGNGADDGADPTYLEKLKGRPMIDKRRRRVRTDLIAVEDSVPEDLDHESSPVSVAHVNTLHRLPRNNDDLATMMYITSLSLIENGKELLELGDISSEVLGRPTETRYEDLKFRTAMKILTDEGSFERKGRARGTRYTPVLSMELSHEE